MMFIENFFFCLYIHNILSLHKSCLIKNFQGSISILFLVYTNMEIALSIYSFLQSTFSLQGHLSVNYVVLLFIISNIVSILKANFFCLFVHRT